MVDIPQGNINGVNRFTIRKNLSTPCTSASACSSTGRSASIFAVTCAKFAAFLKATVGYSVLAQDNALLRDEGWDAGPELQAKRREAGFTCSEEKRKEQ